MRKYIYSIDHNQPEIVDALRKSGCSVKSLAHVGGGVPDLLVGINGQNFLIEVKSEKRKITLTPDQVDFHSSWRGRVFIARSAAEAVDIVRRYADG